MPETLVGVTEEGRRLLIIMCDFSIACMSELSERYGPRIANLSKELPPGKSLTVYQWVGEFIYISTRLERNLNDNGVMETAWPWLERAQRGEPVPPDIRRAVTNLQEAWIRLFTEVEPAAHDWVDSQLRRPEVIEFSNREKELARDKVDEQPNVFYLDQQRQQHKDRESGAWGARVGRAG